MTVHVIGQLTAICIALGAIFTNVGLRADIGVHLQVVSFSSRRRTASSNDNIHATRTFIGCFGSYPCSIKAGVGISWSRATRLVDGWTSTGHPCSSWKFEGRETFSCERTSYQPFPPSLSQDLPDAYDTTFPCMKRTCDHIHICSPSHLQKG